jgi:hypothetical protein
MSKEVAIKNNSFEVEVQTLKIVAQTAQASGLYSGVGGEAKIFMILLAAKELGIPPMQALNGGIYNIQGKIEISARMMTSMIRRAGHSIGIKECNDKICILEGKRADNEDSFCCQFSLEDATKAGLMSRQNWKNYTEDMLYARAMSRLARRLFPDVIGTCYVEGEVRDTIKEKSAPIEDKEPEEAEFTVVEPEVDESQLKASFLLKIFPEDDAAGEDWALAYLEAYRTHNKKTLVQAIQAYEDIEKFKEHMEKWKLKQIEKEKASQP